MEWLKVFKLYNLRRLNSNMILYMFVMISIVVAVAISLSIPQIIFEKEQYYNENALKLNGGELKVETPYISSEFEEKITSLENDGVKVNKITVLTTSFKKNANRFLGSLVIGDYDLKDNEIILYKGLAEELNIKEKDKITIGTNTYVVKAIEKTANGVDGQSEMIGYGKISSYDMDNLVASKIVILIDCEDGAALKEELKKIEPGYEYSTVKDKMDSMQDELNMNATTLNVLNTMSCLMTILSVISGIFLIIVQRQKEIAIIRMLSIRTKSIKKAMRYELYIMIFIPVFLGSILSNLLARVLLGTNGIVLQGFSSDIVEILVSGFFLFLVIYYIFIKIATIAINAISPLFVTRNDMLSWKKSKKKIVKLSLLFTVMTLCLYSIYLGRGSTLVSSIVILLFVLIFFILTVIVINIFSILPIKTKLFVYTIKNIKSTKYSFVFIILSLSLTIWFLLIGFTLEKTIRDSYTAGVEQKVNYNYLVVDNNPEELEKALSEAPDVTAVTKLYRSTGTLITDKESLSSVQVSEIRQSEYHIKFNILEGEDLFEGSEDEVLISSEYSEQMNYNIGDILYINMNDNVNEYKIKGIYEAGGINQTMIIKPYVGVEKSKVMFLVKSESGKFESKIEDASIMHISTMGLAIMKRVSAFLLIFKWLCLICIFSSLLFNLNIMYLASISEYKEIVIIRALGIGKRFLYEHIALKFLIVLAESILMSLGLYVIMMRFALSAIFKVNLELSMSTIILPLCCAIILVVTIFMLPINVIHKSKGFDELREQV